MLHCASQYTGSDFAVCGSWYDCNLLQPCVLRCLSSWNRFNGRKVVDWLLTQQLTCAVLMLLHVHQGLGAPALSRIEVLPPFFNMLSEGRLAQPEFAVWLNPNPMQLDAGEITLGGIDRSRYSGSLTFLPVVSDT